MPAFVFSKGGFCFDKILWASYLAVHAHELSVLLHYAHSGLTGKKFSRSYFSFYAYGSKKKRNCVRQARARSISQTSTHIFIAAVCARGGAAAGWIEKAQSAERLLACRGARCSFSDRAAGGVSAEWRGEA